jgi:predicted dehydrogenase
VKAMKILIIGTGMYVTGRSTTGIGTILPAALKYCRDVDFPIDIYLLATSENSKEMAAEKTREAQKILNTSVAVKFLVGGVSDITSLQSFDCAVVATPDASHYDITKKLLENNIHTLVVKPLATTLSEVEDLIETAQKQNVYGMVEFHKRFDRSNKYLKTVIEDGLIGKPLYFLVQYSQKKVIPEFTFQKWLDQTNIFQYLGIHYVDIIFHVTQATPKRVLSLGQKSYLSSKSIDNYDSIQTLVEWEESDGHRFTSSFLTNWIEEEHAPAMSDQRIKVIGTKGRLEENQKDRGVKIVSKSGYEEVNPDFCRLYRDGDSYDIEGYGIESILTFLRDVRSIKEGKAEVKDFESIRPTFFQSIIPTKVIEASNRSLELNGEWVVIE